MALEEIYIDLLSYYPLEESSGDRVDFWGSNDLADINTVGSTTGQIGDAASFVRANSETLRAANNGVLNLGDEDFTIAFWGRLTAKTLPAQTFVSKFRPATDDRQYFVDYVEGGIDRFRFLVDSTGAGGTTIIEADNLGSPSAGTWYFIVAWHDSSADTINIQINDGTIDSAAHTTGVFQGEATFSLGSYQDASDAPTEELDGDIDEAAIWNRILTSTERSELYNSGSGVNLQNFLVNTEFCFNEQDYNQGGWNIGACESAAATRNDDFFMVL